MSDDNDHKPPPGPLKWSRNRLSEETRLDPRTIKNILQDVPPVGRDGKSELYHMADFINALKGHWGTSSRLESARLKKAEGEADDITMAVEERKRVLVEISHLCRKLEPIYVSFKQIIEATEKLTPEEKDNLLHGLHAIHSAIGEGQESQQQVGDSPPGADTEAPPEA